MLVTLFAAAAFGIDLNACKTQIDAARGGDSVGICIEMEGNRGSMLPLPTEAYVLPNKKIVVALSQCQADRWTPAIGGTAQLTQPIVSGPPAPALTDEQAPPCNPGWQVFSFAPRAPGAVPVTVQNGAMTVALGDLVVAKPVGGAVRVGIGVGTIVDSAFSSVLAPGSQTGEIIATTEGSFEPELVIGFAPFLDKGGRIYEAKNVTRLAPYVGLGAVGVNPANDTALSLLKSVYLGGELELMQHSSLALTAELRRVSRLADPFAVGGPLAVGQTVPTVTSYQLGFAAIFNVSPEFLEYAKKPLDTGKK